MFPSFAVTSSTVIDILAHEGDCLLSPVTWMEMMSIDHLCPLKKHTHTRPLGLRRPLPRERGTRRALPRSILASEPRALLTDRTECKALLVPKQKQVSCCHDPSCETAQLFIGKKHMFTNVRVINSPFSCTMKSQMS